MRAVSREDGVFNGRDRGFIDRRALLTGAAIAGAGSIISPAAALAPVGRVMRVQGSAFLERSTQKLDASAGADLLLDDAALTGDQPSRLDLRLGAATRIRLGSDAKLVIDRFALGLAAGVRLDAGPVFVAHDKGAEPDLTLRSSYALIAARGTAFFAGPSNGVFGVFVQQGAVDVRTRRGSVTVTEGQGTDIRFPGAAPTPVKVWGHARIRAALASVR